jgi:hypothetical protein
MSSPKVPETVLTKSPLDDDVNIAMQRSEIGESRTIDARAERRLVWKFDLRILPVLACMYLFNSLDKSNLGNAKTAGLEGT